jgi:hypothetical protein
MHDVIIRFDFCSYLAVAVSLHVAVRKVANHFPRYSGGMWWAGIATLLLVGGFGYAKVRPAEPETVFGLAIVSWICFSLAALATIVFVPPFASLYEGWKNMAVDRKWEAEQQRQREEKAEANRLIAEERIREAERPKPEKPKPPTRAERIALAKAKHETAVAMLEDSGLSDTELRAGKEKAKQEYLRELDQVLS